MSRVTRKLRIGIALIIGLLLGFGPLPAWAVTTPSTLMLADTPQVIVSEIQMTGDLASEEFVELHNTTSNDIDLADTNGGGQVLWKLQFFSATSTSAGTPNWMKPTTTVVLNGIIPAHGYYVLGSTGYNPGGLTADQVYSSRMSDSGGGLQLVTVAGPAITAYDRVMWKQTTSGPALPDQVLATPVANGSLQRVPNDDDLYFDDDGLRPFVASETTTPGDIWLPPPPVEVSEPIPVEEPTPTNGVETGAEETGNETDPVVTQPTVTDNTGLLPPFLTELLPNPAAPDKDEADEFIELYNPNDTVFNLKGYSLQVGTTTLHNFTFAEDVLVPANGYMAFYSADTRLSLTNSGGQARLLDPVEVVLNESSAYGTATEGQVWALSEGNWQWTTQGTPGLANLITAPTAKVAAKTKAASTATAKKASTKTTKVKGASTTKKVKAAKAPKAKKVKAVKAAALVTPDQEPPRASIHSGILVGVATLAVLYGAYEYRHDISNRLHQLRGNRRVGSYAGR